MSNLVDHIISFLKSTKTKLPWKVSFVILIIGTLLFIDNILGISYLYRVEKEISVVKQLNELAYNQNNDVETKQYAIALKSKVINRKNYFVMAKEAIAKIHWEDSPSEQRTQEVRVKKSSSLVLHLTSSLLFYIMAVLIFCVILFANSNESLYKRLIAAIASAAVFSTFGYLIYVLTSLIPLFAYPIINYLLNTLIQSLVVVGIIWSGNAFNEDKPYNLNH